MILQFLLHFVVTTAVSNNFRYIFFFALFLMWFCEFSTIFAQFFWFFTILRYIAVYAPLFKIIAEADLFLFIHFISQFPKSRTNFTKIFTFFYFSLSIVTKRNLVFAILISYNFVNCDSLLSNFDEFVTLLRYFAVFPAFSHNFVNFHHFSVILPFLLYFYIILRFLLHS